jgi:predicted dehydrogenase
MRLNNGGYGDPRFARPIRVVVVTGIGDERADTVRMEQLGWHVVCDKPVRTDRDQLRALVALAEQQGVQSHATARPRGCRLFLRG